MYTPCSKKKDKNTNFREKRYKHLVPGPQLVVQLLHSPHDNKFASTVVGGQFLNIVVMIDIEVFRGLGLFWSLFWIALGDGGLCCAVVGLEVR